MNVFEMRGPEFLDFYVAAMVSACVAAPIVRLVLWFALGDHDANELVKFDPYETAYLAGGPKHAIGAAIAGLIQRCVLSVNDVSRTVKREKGLHGSGHPLESDVCQAVKSDAGVTLQTLLAIDCPALEKIRIRLERTGLILALPTAGAIRLATVLPLAVVAATGVIKMLVGLSRGRPIGFLLILTAITVFAVAIVWRWKPLRTPAGRTMFKSLQAANAALQTTSTADAKNLSGEDVALAMALFGTSVLLGPALAGLKTALIPSSKSSLGSSWGGMYVGCGSSCGSSSSNGSSCGSSCGGGCGGGGCGGCGG